MRDWKVYWMLPVLVVCFAGIFALVLSLEGAPAGAVGYALLLCVALGALVYGLFLLRAWQQRQKLRDALQKLPYTLEADALPPCLTPGETVYRQALLDLQRAYVLLESQTGRKRADLLDYYTLWVHQIKTPIAAMRLLLQGEPHPAGRELTAELFRIEQYADMALQYLRLDSESSDFVFRSCALDEIVRQAVRKYAPLFIRSQVGLVYDGLDETVLTDSKWLGFVIEQLLSNALKYTPRGTVTISQDGPKTLVIADTGIGIAPEDLPRICEKGFTGYNGRTGQKSTGIGLYLCSRVLKKLGHGFSIASEPGKGTRVTIDLSMVTLPRE